MKFEKNLDGKIVLIKNSTQEEVEFDYPVDAREALLQIDKRTGDAVYSVPVIKKKKLFAPIEPTEEKVKRPGLKVGPKTKTTEIIKDNEPEDDSQGTFDVEESKFE